MVLEKRIHSGVLFVIMSHFFLMTSCKQPKKYHDAEDQRASIVGEGVLKSELQALLNKYPVKHYDASYKKYGLGATEVYIFQNTVS